MTGLRVLLVNGFYYRRGGADAHFLDLVSALPEHECQVAPFAMRHPENLASEWSAYWPENVEYRGRLSLVTQAKLFARSVYSVRVARQLDAMLADFRPDVAHLHGIHHHLTVSVVDVLARRGIPIVWTLHDYRTVCPASAMLRCGRPCELCSGGHFWRAISGRCKSGEFARSVAAATEAYVTKWRKTLCAVSTYVSPSEFLANTVQRMGLPCDKVVVLPNHIEVAERLQWRPEDHFLFVGRLSAEKGLSGLLDALSGVPRAKLVVAGDGPDIALIRAKARRLRVHVTFLGWLGRDEVLREMARARALVFPSVWYENCPISILEAMAIGLPVIASDLGGTTELLDHGRCGTLVPPGDTAKWAETLSAALADVDNLQSAAQRGRLRVRRRHGAEEFYRTLIHVYRDSQGSVTSRELL